MSDSKELPPAPTFRFPSLSLAAGVTVKPIDHKEPDQASKPIRSSIPKVTGVVLKGSKKIKKPRDNKEVAGDSVRMQKVKELHESRNLTSTELEKQSAVVDLLSETAYMSIHDRYKPDSSEGDPREL